MPRKKAGRASKGSEVSGEGSIPMLHHLTVGKSSLVSDLNFLHCSLNTLYFFLISNKHEEQFVSILSMAVSMY